MTRGMMLEFKKHVPILTKLVEQVAFELGDNRVIYADEVAFCDLCIAAKFAPITLRKVPVYILPGESGNEILLGVPEQEALGIASPKELLDQLSQEGAKDITARQFHEEDALNQLFQVMKVKVCSKSSATNSESE
jgi:hypothetical protein